MTPKKVTIFGMPLHEWSYKECIAHFGVGDNWATLYHIKSKEQNKGYAQKLLLSAKDYYENQGKTFGGSVALSSSMKHIYQKLGIKEYE